MIATLMAIKNLQNDTMEMLTESAQFIVANYADWNEEEFCSNLASFTSTAIALNATLITEYFMGEDGLEEMASVVAEFDEIAETIEQEVN